MKRFDILTIFPETIEPYAKASILGRAQKAKLLKIKAHNIRAFSKEKHSKVDDTPYGGGPGMVMTVQPIDDAVRKLRKKSSHIILTSAGGKPFTQEDAKRLAQYDHLIFICGRYEGVDYRVEEAIADESLSIGDYVLTGGELPALVMTDDIARMIPGVLGDKNSLSQESHEEKGVLEYPQFTKPEAYEFKIGRKKKLLFVPPILLSGDHKKIEDWRRAHTKKAT